jgi:MFS transporter, PPP family, 3-phenylpropionic acid transporter
MREPPSEGRPNLHDRSGGANGSGTEPHQFSTADRFALKMGLFYAAYFFFGGVQLPFFPLWLEARGLDSRAIGLIIAVPMIVRIFVTPVIARQADKYHALKATLVTGSIVGVLAMILVGSVEGAVAILLAFALAMAALAPMLSLSDAYALVGLTARGRAYGPVRLWGSVAFIAGNVGAGLILEVIAPGHLIWLMVAALVVVVAAAVALTPVDGARPAPGATPASPRILLRNPAFLAVALAGTMIQGSHALYYGFSTLQWRAAGIDGTVIGMLWGLGVAAEIVLFAYSSRLPKALGPTVLLAIGGIGAILRWTAMAFDPPMAALPALQLLHAASFGAAHLGAMGFLARAVPKELAATAQGYMATLGGIVTASATAISGMVYAASGNRAYLVMAAMGLIGLTSALYAGRRWKG